MSQVLQVIEIFEIRIFRIFGFSGSQKWPALTASNQRSVMLMEIIYAMIIVNFYIMVHAKKCEIHPNGKLF